MIRFRLVDLTPQDLKADSQVTLRNRSPTCSWALLPMLRQRRRELNGHCRDSTGKPRPSGSDGRLRCERGRPFRWHCTIDSMGGSSGDGEDLLAECRPGWTMPPRQRTPWPCIRPSGPCWHPSRRRAWPETPAAPGHPPQARPSGHDRAVLDRLDPRGVPVGQRPARRRADSVALV